MSSQNAQSNGTAPNWNCHAGCKRSASTAAPKQLTTWRERKLRLSRHSPCNSQPRSSKRRVQPRWYEVGYSLMYCASTGGLNMFIFRLLLSWLPKNSWKRRGRAGGGSGFASSPSHQRGHQRMEGQSRIEPTWSQPAALALTLHHHHHQCPCHIPLGHHRAPGINPQLTRGYLEGLCLHPQKTLW